MALVIVPPNQEPSQVSANLSSIAKRLGEPSPTTDTSGPTISFIVSSAVAREWAGVKEPEVKAKAKKTTARKQTGDE